MRLLAILAALLALLLTLAWFYFKPGFDSGVAVAAAFAAFISSFFLKHERKQDSQTQQVSSRSVGIQAGRDANVRDITTK